MLTLFHRVRQSLTQTAEKPKEAGQLVQQRKIDSFFKLAFFDTSVLTERGSKMHRYSSLESPICDTDRKVGNCNNSRDPQSPSPPSIDPTHGYRSRSRYHAEDSRPSEVETDDKGEVTALEPMSIQLELSGFDQHRAETHEDTSADNHRELCSVCPAGRDDRSYRNEDRADDGGVCSAPIIDGHTTKHRQNGICQT